MMVQRLSVGPMQANCYVLGCEETRSALVIDPGDEVNRIISVINENELQLKLIVDTHGHVDHIVANADLKEKTSAQLCIHSADADMLVNPQKNLSFFIGTPVSSPAPDRLLADGDILEVGALNFEVMHTPGHSPGGVCLYGEGNLFTGDTLFVGAV